MSGPLDPIINWLVGMFGSYIPSARPASTLFIVSVAVVLSLISVTASKLLVDYDMVRNNMREFQAWQKEVNKARKANDTKTVEKLMKKQQAISKLQARASMEQFKVTGVTLVPFLLAFYVLGSVFGKTVVAIAPFYLPIIGGTDMTYYYWYFICSLAVNLPMMRLFGVGMTSES